MKNAFDMNVDLEKRIHVVVVPSRKTVTVTFTQCVLAFVSVMMMLACATLFIAPDSFPTWLSQNNSNPLDDNDIEIAEVYIQGGAPHSPDHRATTSDVQPPTGFDVPEYVNATLLEHLDAMRAGFATSMRIPTEARENFVLATSAEPDSVAVLVGGDIEMRDGSDTEILFRQESNFIYLSGFDHPGARLIIGLGDEASLPAGSAWLFVPRGDAVWQGRTETLQDFKDRYDVTDVFWVEDFDSKLESLEPKFVFTFSGVNIKIPESATHDTSSLRSWLTTARVVKTPGEIEFLRGAADISVESHKFVMKQVQCGAYESDMESLFRFVGHNYGARFQAYIPIVGGGVNAAALHYNDNDQMIPEGAVLLLDAGAELGGTRNGGGWTTDITRTMPCSGTFSIEQKTIYDIVYTAEDACVKMCVPGQSMGNATTATNRIIIQGLLDARILKDGTVDELIAKRLYSVFMPHGLGHSVGLDVHDPGNITPFRAGMVVTCEPGIYFIESLLEKALANPSQAPHIDVTILDRYKELGGYRLEDTVLITAGAPDNLSGGAPRTSAEIERFMAPSHQQRQQQQQ